MKKAYCIEKVGASSACFNPTKLNYDILFSTYKGGEIIESIKKSLT